MVTGVYERWVQASEFAHLSEGCLAHLACQAAPPNELVKQAPSAWLARGEGGPGEGLYWNNRLVCLLCILDVGFEGGGLVRKDILAIKKQKHTLAQEGRILLGHLQAICSMIRDQSICST
jgi:hypothetical protein